MSFLWTLSANNARPRSRVWLGGLLAVFMLATTPVAFQRAEAAFPGRNGLIVFEVEQTPASAIGGGLNGDIYVVGANGLGVQVVTQGPEDDHFPAWSPDGTRIAFTRSVGNRLADIYVMDSSGGNILNLTPGTPQFADTSPAWSPDGTRIAFIRKPVDVLFLPTVTNGDLYVMQADGSDPRRVGKGETDAGSPAWSPDGFWIAYSATNSNAIHLVSFDGRVRGSVQPPGGLPYRPTAIDWSPDGKRLIFSMSASGTLGERAFASDIWVIGLNGRNLQNLTGDAIGVSADDKSASWSPDGKRSVFVSNRDGPYYLFKMRADGSKVERLVGIQLSGSSTPSDWGPRP